jgi:hypothetical protein
MHYLHARRARPEKDEGDIQAERWAWALLVVAVTYLSMRILPVLVPAIWEAAK